MLVRMCYSLGAAEGIASALLYRIHYDRIYTRQPGRECEGLLRIEGI